MRSRFIASIVSTSRRCSAPLPWRKPRTRARTVNVVTPPAPRKAAAS